MRERAAIDAIRGTQREPERRLVLCASGQRTKSARPANHVFQSVASDPSVAFIGMDNRSATNGGVTDADANSLHVGNA